MIEAVFFYPERSYYDANQVTHCMNAYRIYAVFLFPDITNNNILSKKG